MTDDRSRDNLYAKPIDQIVDFRFDDAVADVFPDMIQRSVPGYTTILHMIGQLSARYCQANSLCYDLGCSLGAATLAMRHRISAANARIIAVDNSEAMTSRAKQVIRADSSQVPVDIRKQDILDTDIQQASVTVLNFTLQFVELAKREAFLGRIADGTLDGGIAIISEKISLTNDDHQALMTDMHHDFKRLNGYSDLEIAQKRNAIEKVLLPETLATHRARLQRVGFSSVVQWFQCFNFASFIAFK